MKRLKSLQRIFTLTISFVLIASFSQVALASGSYAPPQARGVNSAKVELYHLGKRLTLKRIDPSPAANVTAKIRDDQRAHLAKMVSGIQKKHLKTLNLDHLQDLLPSEFEAVVVYLATRYGIKA